MADHARVDGSIGAIVSCGGVQVAPVLVVGTARPPGEDGIRCGMSAGHGLRDAFSLQGVDQARRVAHEQHARPGWRRAHHAQLEPSTEPGHRRVTSPAG